MSDLEILETISSFPEFDAELIASYCDADQDAVLDLIGRYPALFEGTGGRHARTGGWRVADAAGLHREIELLADITPSPVADPREVGIVDRLRAAHAHIALADSLLHDAAWQVPAHPDGREDALALLEDCVELLRLTLQRTSAPLAVLEPTAGNANGDAEKGPAPAPGPATGPAQETTGRDGHPGTVVVLPDGVPSPDDTVIFDLPAVIDVPRQGADPHPPSRPGAARVFDDPPFQDDVPNGPGQPGLPGRTTADQTPGAA